MIFHYCNRHNEATIGLRIQTQQPDVSEHFLPVRGAVRGQQRLVDPVLRPQQHLVRRTQQRLQLPHQLYLSRQRILHAAAAAQLRRRSFQALDPAQPGLGGLGEVVSGWHSRQLGAQLGQLLPVFATGRARAGEVVLFQCLCAGGLVLAGEDLANIVDPSLGY